MKGSEKASSLLLIDVPQGGTRCAGHQENLQGSPDEGRTEIRHPGVSDGSLVQWKNGRLQIGKRVFDSHRTCQKGNLHIIDGHQNSVADQTGWIKKHWQPGKTGNRKDADPANWQSGKTGNAQKRTALRTPGRAPDIKACME